MNRWLLVLFACLAACRKEPSHIQLRGVGNPSLLTWSPANSLTRVVKTSNGIVEIEVARGVEQLRFEHPDACPLDVKVGPGLKEASLAPWLRVPADLPQVGFGQTANVVIAAGCPEARAGTITWRENEGVLAGLDVQSNGFVLKATLKPFSHSRTGHNEIIPISFAERDSHELVGTWRGEGHAPIDIRFRLNASTRVSGLPNITVNQVVYLEGTKWSVLERPAGSAERLQPIDDVTLFQANHVGRWVLQNQAGPFSLQVGTFASTPLDCGRSGCHTAATEAFDDNPMKHAFEHRMAQAPNAMSCWLGCHVVGEDGLYDEGFFDVARSFETRSPLPRALARTTGVQCLNCHGSGRIPEPSARWTVLQVGVCATCHDASPRYGHVQAWRESAMSRADVVQDTRVGACATCHTTAGFLSRSAPKEASPIGITCTACHAPHSAHGPRLLRELPLPLSLGEITTDPTTKLCAQCHAPKNTTSTPESTAASIVLGRGAVSLLDGSALNGTSTSHSKLEGGCVACHSHSIEKVERGATHGFEARVEDCAGCHAARGLLPPDTSVKTRERFNAKPVSHMKGNAPIDLTTRAGRLEWNKALLHHDRAAWAHNPSYADSIFRETQ